MGQWIKQSHRGLNPGKDPLDKIMSSDRWTYLQFVPGHVETCITSVTNETSVGKERNINAIMATNHYDSTDGKNNNLSKSNIYYPLFRGITDVPTQGDPVLLCNFDGVNYYIGPLNTINSPNFNPDGLVKDPSNNKKISMYEKFDVNPAFSWNTSIKRLQKTVRNKLDSVNIDKNNLQKMTNIKNHGVGDLMLEGRFGNSIRIGSRGTSPNIIISNGRKFNQTQESLSDSSIISISDNGTLFDHFGSDFIPSADIDSDKPLILFEDDNISQVLIRSNKITIDSKQRKLLLSSFHDIDLISNLNINLFARNGLVLESKNIYLGKKIFDNETNTPDLERGEPLVMGETLVKILEELIDAIGNIFVGGTVGGTSIPVNASASPGWNMLNNQIKSKLQDIKSFYHYIEKNDEAEKEL